MTVIITYEPEQESDISHYGVLGMKWGVRRYQNEDGSLKAAGKKHYDEVGAVAKAHTVKNRASQAKAIAKTAKRMGGVSGITKKTIANAKKADIKKMNENYTNGLKTAGKTLATAAGKYARKKANERGAGKIAATFVGSRVASVGVAALTGTAAAALVASGHPIASKAAMEIGTMTMRSIQTTSDIRNGAAIVGHILNYSDQRKASSQKEK